jgi:hypothetical protein
MNATYLKMVGRQRKRRNVAERLRKPVSGTVAGGVGPVGGQLAAVFGLLSGSLPVRRKDVDSGCLMR